MKQKIYVHVADDHKIVIEGIIAVINTDEDIEVIESSLTGKEVTDWFDNKENKADVLILDITMPILDGIGVLKYFNEKNIVQKVIILSSYDDIKIVQEMLKLGCSGYITKNSAGEHIIKAIKAVANGEQYFSDDIQKTLLKFFSGQIVPKGISPDDFETEPLTEREVEVLKLLASGKRNKDVALGLNLNEKTVSTYKARLMKKLNVDNMVDLLQQAKALELY